MVGITVECRLGNQLFQYAFIKSLSVELKTGFFLNESLQSFTAAKYFDLQGYSWHQNVLNKFLFKIRTGSLLRKLSNRSFDNFSNPDVVLEGLEDSVSYGGYFQSVKYFRNIADQISNYIKVKDIYKKDFQTLYGSLFEKRKTIVMHIRRTDYLSLGNWWLENFGSSDLSLPKSYYMMGLDKIANLHEYQIIVISDDIEFVKEEYKELTDAIFSTNDLIIDFQILMNADISIISCSSFAWWAAFLNSKPGKIIYCPEYWLGHKVHKEYPAEIIPDSWNKIIVN